MNRRYFPIREGNRLVLHDGLTSESDPPLPETTGKCEVCGDQFRDEDGKLGEKALYRFGLWVCTDLACTGTAAMGCFREWAVWNACHLKRAIGVPPAYARVSASTMLGLPERVAALLGYTSRPGLLLHGISGSGKTTLLSAWLTCALPTFIGRGGLCALWVSCQDFLERVKASFDKGSTEEVFSRYVEPDLLCLDDLGTEKASDWSRSVLYRLVEKRLADEKFTAITTTMTPGELFFLDARLASRLSLFLTCHLKDDDLRERLEEKERAGRAVARALSLKEADR